LVAAVLDLLSARAVLDSTYVLYSSDHGYKLGQVGDWVPCSPWRRSPWHCSPWHYSPWRRSPWHCSPWHCSPWHCSPWHCSYGTTTRHATMHTMPPLTIALFMRRHSSCHYSYDATPHATVHTTHAVAHRHIKAASLRDRHPGSFLHSRPGHYSWWVRPSPEADTRGMLCGVSSPHTTLPHTRRPSSYRQSSYHPPSYS
jgi:hypothetical protein